MFNRVSAFLIETLSFLFYLFLLGKLTQRKVFAKIRSHGYDHHSLHFSKTDTLHAKSQRSQIGTFSFHVCQSALIVIHILLLVELFITSELQRYGQIKVCFCLPNTIHQTVLSN